MSEILKTNPHFLKSCILYEVLRKTPIQDAFRNFCKLVGQDAMEYSNYEIFHSRLSRGERDFEIEPKPELLVEALVDNAMPMDPVEEVFHADPGQKSLMNMPVALMFKIAGNLDPVERTVLRSVNKAIKNVADSLPPVFESMSITWTSCNSLYWQFNDNPATHSGNGKLGKLSKIRGFKLNNLRLRNYGDLAELSSIILRADLPMFYRNLFLNRKMWISMCLQGFDSEVLSNFSHLKSFKIKLSGDFVEEDFPKIRDTISTFESFEKCELRIISGFQIQNICEALGMKIPGGPLKSITHRYQIPESNKCLQFEIKGGGPSILMKIVSIR